MWLFNLLFSSLSQLWYVEVRISRSVSVSPLEFEITRVDCMWRAKVQISQFIPAIWLVIAVCLKGNGYTWWILKPFQPSKNIFCDLMLVVQHANPLWKRGLVQRCEIVFLPSEKERICSPPCEIVLLPSEKERICYPHFSPFWKGKNLLPVFLPSEKERICSQGSKFFPFQKGEKQFLISQGESKFFSFSEGRKNNF